MLEESSEGHEGVFQRTADCFKKKPCENEERSPLQLSMETRHSVDSCSKHVRGVDSLPEHLLISVMHRLDRRDVLSLGAASRRLRRLCFYPTLWQGYRLYMRYTDYPTIDPLQIQFYLTMLPKLIPGCISSVTWKMPHGFSPALFEIAMRNPCMTELHITDDDLEDEQVIDLCRMLRCLQKVTLSGCRALEGSCLKYLGFLPHLRCIDLSYSDKITDESFTQFSSSAGTLETVNIDYVSYISNSGITSLLSSHHRSLRYLNLDGELTDDSAFLSIPRCENLRNLVINYCQNLTDETLQYISFLPNLEELSLKKGENFSEVGFVELFRNCKMGGLKTLKLVDCPNVSDEAVGNMSRQCGRLTTLSLFACWRVTEAGLKCIVNGCARLEEMDLSCLHMITGECLETVPECLPRLRFLKVDMCGVDEDILRRLVFRTHGTLKIPSPI